MARPLVLVPTTPDPLLLEACSGLRLLRLYEHDHPALDGAVLLPHVGSASLPTRRDMAEPGARNLTSWFADRTVLTPVPEARERAHRTGG